MRKLFLLLILFVGTFAFAQKKPAKADRLYDKFSFVEASKAYGEYLEKESSPSDETLERAAESFYFIGDRTNAAKWYKQLYQKKSTEISEQTFYRFVASLKSSGELELANSVTTEYLSQKNPERLAFVKAQKLQRDSLAQRNPLYEVKNLEINSDKSDFGTSFFGTKVVYASSKNLLNEPRKIYNWNQQPFLKLYVADIDPKTGSLFNDQPFLTDVTGDYHDATVSFSPNLQWVYLSTSITKRKSLINNDVGTNNFKITRGKLFNNTLTDKQDLKFSSVDYSVGHPNVSPDGKWLYFSSDMPGGFGGADIYRASIAENGSLGTPENLGNQINSVLNDVFPFFVNETLYYASDGHFGYGGLDIFMSRFNSRTNQFSAPKNLGEPLNSSADDFAYIINKEETTGYFSSNREGGKGDDDIYYFSKKALCNQDIPGIVSDVRTKAPISGATVKAYLNSGGEIIQATTNEKGLYTLNVPCEVKIKLLASKPDYNVEFAEVMTGRQNQGEIKNTNFELVRYEDLIVRQEETEKIDINPIFFDYNKSNINKQAAVELDKVVYALTKFPDVKIKIETHTDARGKDEYNLKLSDDRAKSSYNYLIEKGIDPSRIQSVTGFGESRIINKCKNGVKCSDAEHLVNRRSDFIVIQK